MQPANTPPSSPTNTAAVGVSPARQVMRSVRNRFGRDKWDYPDDYDGPRDVRISQRPKLHADVFPREVSSEFTMWLDKPWVEVQSDSRYTGALPTIQTAIARYYVDGFWQVDGLFQAEEIDRVFAAYLAARDADAIAEGTMGRRHLNPQRFVPEIHELFADRRLMQWIDLFMGRPSIPFQTIVGQWGTAQEIHTDAIHQTTFPLGFHVSAWLACEDIALEAGPLFYYPRSHRLPYVLNQDCGIDNDADDMGAEYRDKYIPHIQAVVVDNGLHRQEFLAKKGDVLIWHHNLLHGGSAILDPGLTRQAMALFFYGKGALHYHDLSGDRAAPTT
jgi:ectoine hydroxylase-related dioxygenase (phytanoyl-CoA dioxygenase family)